MIISARDVHYGAQLRRRRRLAVGSMCCLFMAGMILFGESLLQVYGPDFKAGYPALCFIALGASVTTLFSLAPTYLNFKDRSGLVIAITINAAIAMVCLTAVLGYMFGATGAGVALCIVMTSLAMVYLITATRDFYRLEQG